MKEMLTIRDEFRKQYHREALTDQAMSEFDTWSSRYSQRERWMQFRTKIQAAILILASAGAILLAAHSAGLL